MLQHLALIALVILVPLNGIVEANSDVETFWTKFRAAVLSEDSGRVAAMTRFPFWVRGPDDSDPVVYYDRESFDGILEKLLDQKVSCWAGGEVVTKTMREIVRTKVNTTSKDLITPHVLWVELFRFEKTDGKWLFTRGYLEDGAY